VSDSTEVEVRAGQRDVFTVPADVAYFNTANLSPQLKSVRTAGEHALERRSRPWTITAEDWFTDAERLRGLFGSLIGDDAEGIALVPATSYGFAVAARNIRLRAGDKVLVLAEEYPSGIYTWRAATKAVGAEIVTVRRSSGQTWTEAVLHALDDRVTVVSVPNVHWTDGAVIDLQKVSDRAHEIGARLIIDGSQSLGAIPLDVARIRPDFLVTVGYKWLLGPFGVGYLYVAPEYRDGEPLEQNWILRDKSEDFARLVDYRDEYQAGSRRFDVGERTKFETIPMAIAALEQLTAWQVPRIADALGVVTAAIADRATDLGFEPLPPDQRSSHMLGIRLPESVRSRVLPTMADVNCFAAVRGDSLRVAPHLHITDHDVSRLIQALTSAKEDPR
jgi:selenocysteine lyase/cysteine desulfurase